MKTAQYTVILGLIFGLTTNVAMAEPVAHPVTMTAQIQRLLNEKQEKISKLEECDGKRKGFMIAGISTLGLTAVGVGVNIAQASKSNKLSNQIAEQNLELEKQQNKIADLNAQISQKTEAQKRQDCESDGTRIWVNGVCINRAQYNCEQYGGVWDGINCTSKPNLSQESPSQEILSSPTPKEELPNDNPEALTMDTPTTYKNMNELTAALDKECTDTGGTGRNKDGECNCPEGMTQSTDKRRCDQPALTDTQPTANSTKIRPDWSMLENPTSDYGITKEKFCSNLKNNSFIGFSIATRNYLNQQQLDAAIKHGAGHGYQCKQLGGKWAVIRQYYGRDWSCTIDPSVCRTQSQKNNDAKDLATYKQYKIQCDKDKDVFMFASDVPGAKNEITRITDDCINKYHGKATRTDSRRTEGDLTGYFTMIVCLNATGCGGNVDAPKTNSSATITYSSSADKCNLNFDALAENLKINTPISLAGCSGATLTSGLRKLETACTRFRNIHILKSDNQTIEHMNTEYTNDGNSFVCKDANRTVRDYSRQHGESDEVDKWLAATTPGAATCASECSAIKSLKVETEYHFNNPQCLTQCAPRVKSECQRAQSGSTAMYTKLPSEKFKYWCRNY